MRVGSKVVSVFCIYVCFFSIDILAVDLTESKKKYQKDQVYIPMRDGTLLFTIIYRPKDKSKNYPFLINRTPYGVGPYEVNEFKPKLGPSYEGMEDGYIFVYQDVRGKMMSKGLFKDVRPMTQDTSKECDESTDAYDTVNWLLKNTKGHNGKVGFWGLSYGGFYTLSAYVKPHPAVVCISPQAPLLDWYQCDDFHQNGAFLLSSWVHFFYSFGKEREGLTVTPLKRQVPTKGDEYGCFLKRRGFSSIQKDLFRDSIAVFHDFKNHPDLDTFWEERNLLPHLKTQANIGVLLVTGTFDVEDYLGPWAFREQLLKSGLINDTQHESQNSPQNGFQGGSQWISPYKGLANDKPQSTMFWHVNGPWSHGEWVWGKGTHLGDLSFGDSTAVFYRQQIERRFFYHHLHQPDSTLHPRVDFFFKTGSNRWSIQHSSVKTEEKTFYLLKNSLLENARSLKTESSNNSLKNPFNNFLNKSQDISKAHSQTKTQPHSQVNFKPNSQPHTQPKTHPVALTFQVLKHDPLYPVPTQEEKTGRFEAKHAVADQSFTIGRKDVLTFKSNVLLDSLTIEGKPKIFIVLQSKGTDTDLSIKLCDAFQEDNLKEPNVKETNLKEHNLKETNLTEHNLKDNQPYDHPLNNYNQKRHLYPIKLMHARLKYRKSLIHPMPLHPNGLDTLEIDMPYLTHTWLPGHQLILQIQTSYFPFVDLNPQYFTNTYLLDKKSRYDANTIKVYSNSYLTLPVVKLSHP